jgi:hypothetical protein
MVKISTPKCVDGESLQEWLSNFIKTSLDVGAVYLLADKPWDCTSQSSTFVAIDIEEPLSKDALISKIADCSCDKYAYFYIRDALSAAYGCGLVDKGYYHVYHENSH